MKKPVILLATHALVAAAGFAAGIYALPILIAPPSPPAAMLERLGAEALFTGHFRRDLKGSDLLHWGEGRVAIGRRAVSLQGELAPGPDYKLYLSPEFVATEADFLRLKPTMVRAGDVRTFRDFVVPLPAEVDPGAYNSVIVWCESFGRFITSARYR